jgi:hypothetical protein
MAITPVAIIEFAIGLIVVMVVLYIIYMVIDFLAPGNLAIPIKYVIGALALIAILIVAEKALFGGGLGFISSSGAGPFPSEISEVVPFDSWSGPFWCRSLVGSLTVLRVG